jgi:hypothetical protein
MNKYFAKGLIDRWKYKHEFKQLKEPPKYQAMSNNKPLSKEEKIKKAKEMVKALNWANRHYTHREWSFNYLVGVMVAFADNLYNKEKGL